MAGLIERHGKAVAARFSAAAATYSRHDSVQRVTARWLGGLLPEAPQRRILEIGAGTGILTVLLAGRFPDASIDAIDVSEEMLRQAAATAGRAENVRWIKADLLEYRPRVRYELAVSNAALHWIYPWSEAFEAIRRLLAAGGKLVCSFMLRGTLQELHMARQAVAPRKRAAVQLPEKEEVLRIAEKSGFSVETCFERTLELVFPDAAAMLKCLHEQGVTGGFLSAGRSLLTRSELAALLREYARANACRHGVKASYRVLALAAVRRGR